ncbi:MAG: cytidylate kinase family protein [Erysipelotrichaceae bacterium]|nr:cytidylate kinase family protein [Erysipelotrichaceae bacterium]
MENKRNEFMKRCLLLVAGLFFLALGVALSVRSGLGVSPSSSLSYLLGKIFSISMGSVTVSINIIYVLIQVFLLKKEYRLMNLLQLLTVFLFGYFTDYTLSLTSNISLSSYLLNVLLCIFSCALMGFGLYLEINARLLTMASEGAISVIAKKMRKQFGQIKIGNDVLFVALSAMISLLVYGKIDGVREGTLLSAFLVGYFSQLCSRYLPFFKSEEEKEVFVLSEDYPLVITIERELGSGGHEIGERIAKELGIAFYDYDLIEKAAAETGLSNELITRKEERVNGVWYTLYNQSYGYTRQESETDAIFDAQKKVIRDIAGKESCVIVGRLGAYILKNRPNTFNIFISADRNYRAERLSQYRHEDKQTILEDLEWEDNLRKSYCRHFTGHSWGLARHYHICLDSSVYGKDKSFEILKDAIEGFRK